MYDEGAPDSAGLRGYWCPDIEDTRHYHKHQLKKGQRLPGEDDPEQQHFIYLDVLYADSIMLAHFDPMLKVRVHRRAACRAVPCRAAACRVPSCATAASHCASTAECR